jgi:uncharacterized protein (TIGR03437 family)
MCFMASLVAAEAFAQAPVIGAVVNAGSFQNQVSPGSTAAILGTDLAPAGTANLSVTWGGLPAHVIFPTGGQVSGNQVNIQIPVNAPLGSSTVVLSRNGVSSNAFSVTLSPYSPAFSTVTANGTGIGTFRTTSGALISASRPAVPGETLSARFVNGLGPTSPAR